jgi:polyribonucleotide nucleotidyltransferase
VLGYDKEHAPDPLAMVASAAALLASPIPYTKPVAGVAVGMDADGKCVCPGLSYSRVWGVGV